MLLKVKQVALIYLSIRWIWVISLIMAVVTLGVFFGSNPSPVFALGLPIMTGLIWVSSVFKWQFANPRARLVPGFAAPHLMIFTAILFLLAIANPLLIAIKSGSNPLGFLAFTLSLTSCMLMGHLLGRAIFILPALLIFFSGYSKGVGDFWFANAASVSLIHAGLAFAGLGMIAYCLWYLSQLTEEMDEYQITPMGAFNLSRIERVEQRRLVGRAMKKRTWMLSFTDRWLDRNLTNIDPTQRNTLLAEFGIAGTPGYVSAILAGVAFVVYSLVFMQFDFLRQLHAEAVLRRPPGILLGLATMLPGMTSGITLMQHKSRLAQELLRPAWRTNYFDTLFLSLAKRSLSLWLGLFIGVCLVAAFTDTFPQTDAIRITCQFALLSITSQLIAFGLSLRLALLKSLFAYMTGVYILIPVQLPPIGIWYWYESNNPGNGFAFPAVLLFNLLLGPYLILWARRKWNQAEIG